MNTQLKKGILELCVLSVISKHDSYGYEIIDQIKDKIPMSEGTIYPMLRRLKTTNTWKITLSNQNRVHLGNTIK